MRFTADHPLVLDDGVETRSPPRHVVTTGVLVGLGVQLHEELWVQGALAERMILEGAFVLVDDDEPAEPAPTVEQVDPVLRRRQQVRLSKETDGTVLAPGAGLYPPPPAAGAGDGLEGVTVRVIGADGTERDVDGDPGEGAQVGGFTPPPSAAGVGMPPPPAAKTTSQPRKRRVVTKGQVE